MTLADLKNAVTSLIARADGALKLEVQQLSARVDTELTALNDQLVAVTAENTKLKEDYHTLDTELTAARLTNAEFKALNESLTDACLAAKVLTAEKREDALLVPAAQKFASYQGALNKAFLAANVPPAAMPTAPTAPVATGSEKFDHLTGLDRAIAARTAAIKAARAAKAA